MGPRVRHVLAATGVALLLAGGPASASTQAGPSGTMVQFNYKLTDAVKGYPRIVYSTGVLDTAGGTVLLESGQVKRVQFLSNAWTLLPTGNDKLSAEIDDWRLVTGPTVTGTAYLPAGASLTVSAAGSEPIQLGNGEFSFPTGVGLLGAAPREAGPLVVKCRGDQSSCRARVPLTGGARDRTVVVKLTNPHLSLRAVTAPPPREQAAYSLTDGHEAHDASEYVITLNAARSSPAGSALILSFG